MKKVRILSAVMAVCMTLTLLPVSALATGAEHLDTCDYVCTHEHSEDCGYYVHSTQNEPCDHSDDCGYVADTAPCTHEAGHEIDVTSEDAAACTHTCGDDEWVCDKDCNPAKDEVNLFAANEPELTQESVKIYYYDWVVRDWHAYKSNIAISYTKGDSNSRLEAAKACSTSQEILRKLQETEPYYYISAAKDMTTYIRVDLEKRTVGDITATAENGSISYKTAAMSEAAAYTAPVPNATPMTFYFTPNEGYELGSAKLGKEDITLGEEENGTYSYKIANESLYTVLTLTVTFIQKPTVVDSLELDMNNGPVTVEKNGEALLVNQNGTRYILTGDALTLTGTMAWGEQMPKSTVVAIGDGVELDLIAKALTITGYWSRKQIITIGENAKVNVKLQGETVLFGATASAIKLATGADVTISGDTLKATNSGQDDAVISVPQGAKLTIDGATVTAIGGGAGIGSDTNHLGATNEIWSGTIEMINGANVTAHGGTGAAAIGGGEYANNGSILIGAGCTVDATAGGNGAAAIGGGEQATDGRGGGRAGTIVIEAGATVTAKGNAGSAIGRGLRSGNGSVISDTSGSITIAKGAKVTAYALGHDNSTGEHGKPYYFAIDAGILNDGDAPILNARFDKGALPRKSVIDKTDPQNPVNIPQYNDIAVIGNEQVIPFALPASPVITAFATTVSGAGSYMVANATEDKTLERAKYLLENQDSQYLFTVGEGMTTRDQLAFAAFTITATAGTNGTISDAGATSISPLGDKTYTVTPDAGYVVDSVTVDGQTVTVTDNTYTFSAVTDDHTIAVTFKTAPVNPGVPTYKITVKYVDEKGETLAEEYTTRKDSGTKYDVSAQAAKVIDGYTIDRVDGEVKGTLRSSVTVTVHYNKTIDDKPPVTPEIPETPTTEIPEEETPKTDLPEVEIPAEETPKTDLPTEEPKDDTVIVEPEVPLGNLPQTGTVASPVNTETTLGLLALSLSLAVAGLTVIFGGKKKEEN